jgi:hypothetical protein
MEMPAVKTQEKPKSVAPRTRVTQGEEQQEVEGTTRVKRKKLGRAARRRNAKARSINQAVDAILRGGGSSGEYLPNEGDGEITAEYGTPDDRHLSLPGVITRRQQEQQSQDEASMHNPIDNGNKSAEPITPSNWGNALDEQMLTSQLGFIPGNGLCVASRVKHLQQDYPHISQLLLRDNDSNGSSQQALLSSTESPTVLKLYPLVIREVHSGGKKNGQKFKSRKRGHLTIVDDNDNENEEKTDTVTKDQQQETPCESTTQTNTTTTCIEPFPTMYWLTHPHLRTLISQIEISSTHNVTYFEQKLLTESSPKDNGTSDTNTSCTAITPLESMKGAHLSYGQTRYNLLTTQDLNDIILPRKWSSALGMERGVAGIRSFEKIKCLHAHAAHYLAQLSESSSISRSDDWNVVGRWTIDAIEEFLKKNSTTTGANTSPSPSSS